MSNPIKTEVLIVGAGPTGLMLGAQLARYGVDFVICDQKDGPTNLSKAVVVHARSLEIYDQLGLAQTAVQEGEIAKKVALMRGGEVTARIDLDEFGGQLSPFPFLLIFEQSKNERLLVDFLQNQGHQVLWQHEMQSLMTQDEGAETVFTSAEGQTQRVQARYVVGCDGASSTTRHQLGLGFEGSTYPRLFYVADVQMEFEAEPSTTYAAFSREAFVLLFPLQGEKRWRIIGNMPATEDGDDPANREVAYEEIEDKIKALVQRPLDITQVHWFSTYKVHTRHAEEFSRGCCFLAGDAAHVHTPAGGQGMNTGLQDAYNLAWKLAFVLRGRASEALLATYNEERLANVKRLLHTTDTFFDVAVGQHWYQRVFRNDILPRLAHVFSHSGAAKEFLFPTVSQIGINYRENSLSQHEGDTRFEIKSGDRLPYFKVDGASIYDQLHAPKFHLLAFSDDESDYTAQKQTVKAIYGDWLDFQVIPLLPRVTELFGTNEPFQVLVRPDNYIAFLDKAITPDSLTSYFGAHGFVV